MSDLEFFQMSLLFRTYLSTAPFNIDFGRPPRWNCPSSSSSSDGNDDDKRPKRKIDSVAATPANSLATTTARTVVFSPAAVTTSGYVPAVTRSDYPEITTTPLRHWNTRAMPTTTMAPPVGTTRSPVVVRGG